VDDLGLDRVTTTILPTFICVLTRMSGMFLTAPFFSSQSVPRQVRVFLCIAFAALTTGFVQYASPTEFTSLAEFIPALAKELFVGTAVGVVFAATLSGMKLAGQTLNQISGIQQTDVSDAEDDDLTSVYGKFLQLFALSTLLVIGGHRWILRAVLDSFERLPPGGAKLEWSWVELVSVAAGESLSLGFRIAAPTGAALFIATLVLGLVSRTVQQLNIPSLGLNLNAMILLGALGLSLGTGALTFSEEVERMFVYVQHTALGQEPSEGSTLFQGER
jgi:flagellar biosynthetic protein FliR